MDVMLDIETTGTAPDEAAIIQIAAVKFDLEERTVDQNFFNRCLSIPPKRFWDESTRAWWGKQDPEILTNIYSRMEDPETVLRDLVKWVGGSANLWAKPTTFDASFIQSYMRQFNIGSPFHYRNNIDLNSFLRGLAGSTVIPHIDIDFVGAAHDAIFDSLNQIALLFKAMDIYRPRPIEFGPAIPTTCIETVVIA